MLRNDDLSNWTYPAGSDHCNVAGKDGFKEDVTPDPNPNPNECVINKHYSSYYNANLNNNVPNDPENVDLNNVIINTLPVDDQNNTIHEWSGDDAAQKWADGKYGIVLWSSHGSRKGAVIDINDIATLEDYYPVHTFQASCQTGWPEDPKNLATSLLRHGAVTTIAASRYAWAFTSG